MNRKTFIKSIAGLLVVPSLVKKEEKPIDITDLRNWNTPNLSDEYNMWYDEENKSWHVRSKKVFDIWRVPEEAYICEPFD